MPNNWKTYKLKEVTDLSTGFAFKSKFYENIGTLKVIRGINVTEGNLRWGDNSRFWNHSSKEYSKYLIELDDIVIGMDGSKIGKNRAIVRKTDLPAILAQRVARIQAIEGVSCQKYIWQLINNDHFENYVNNIQTGTSIPHISLGQIGNLEIKLPSLQEQQAIASILSAIDDKIENNLAINKTLEEMAMALYKHWFVDFGPFQEGEFVESELGMIPKGWEVKSLENIGDFKNGKGINASKRSDDGKYIILGSNGIIGRTNEIMFKEPVIAIGRVGANYGEVHYSIEPCWISDNAITVQAQIKSHYWFIYQILREVNYSNFAVGSAQPLITQSSVKALKFPCPDLKSLDSYSSEIEVLYNKRYDNLKINETLTQLRDTLLPKLISGEVRLKEFQEQLATIL